MGKIFSKGLFFILFLLLGFNTAYSQVKRDFAVRYEADIRGEITFIANNIVNRYIPESSGRRWVWRNGRWRRENFTIPEVSPNEPYNDTRGASSANDSFDMRYIDVDGDSSTFSSSSATLNIPDYECSMIRYAGLYWSAVYTNADRSNIDEIKFRVPGGAYQDIVADDELFDGFNDIDFGYYAPYAYYKDITSIVSALPNPNGEYFVANVRADNSRTVSGGISGGWKMVVVYENPNLPGDKFITTFDGYAGIKSGESVDIPISGYTTLPAPFPVYANMGVAALEGDNVIDGDALQINANGSFTTLSNGENPANNFFNSSITIDDVPYTNRNPNSINTLGWDVDYFEIPNGGVNNTIIPNGSTSATLRATSSQDKYDIFFASFDVDIIAPNIVLEKRVQTPGGVDITGEGVNLGQTLDYVLTFENIGNDDGVGYTIRDVLPVNVSPPNGRSFFNASDFSYPDGVTYTYDPLTREIIFSVPDRYVEDEDSEYSIRFRVQVAENCFDFVNACSDLIENVAYGTYRGENNSAMVTDDPSVSEFNSCGFTVPGATNFLLDDLSACSFDRTVTLCGANTILTAGQGFDSYVWYQDTNGNGELDSLDVEINDGDPDNDPSTQVVTTPGVYIVDKIVAAPCIGYQEVITVEPFGSGNIPNPVTEYFNEVNNDSDPSNDIPGEIVNCTIDNSFIPKIFLCGINDSQPLAVNIVDAQSVSWELLDEGSCAPVGEDCANKALTCNWTEVGTGSNFLLNAPGEYRLSVINRNGCISRYYFKGFQNNLDIDYTNRDIVCNTDGNITITNLGSGYGYQLIDNETNNILVPFSANNGPSFDFSSGENGSYRVEVTPTDINGDVIPNACVFTTEVIGILDRDVTYNVNVTPEFCYELGSINLQINNADAVYNYEIRIDDGSNGGLGTLLDSENGQTDNNFTFTDLSAGGYIALISTADGCSYSENVTIVDNNDLTLSARVSQHITCREGNIQMDSDGGTTPHTYAIWSYVDESGNTVTSYPSYADIPATNFQTSQIFDILDPGAYTFVVLDRNGCYQVSNTVEIEFQPAAEFNATTVVDVNCFGDASGRLQYNLIDNNGYQLTFSLFDADDQPLGENGTGNFSNLPAGDYRVLINQRRGSASCDYEENYTIGSPASAVQGDAVLIQDYTCVQDGIIEAQNVTGGVAPYEYSIDGVNFIPDTVANANRFENLVDGSYYITIRDANGCIFITNVIMIDAPNPPTDLNITATQITCPDQTVDLRVSTTNGSAPFTYAIVAPTVINPTSTVGNEANFDGLAPDTYTVRVTDTDGCFYEENYTINGINPISASGTTVQPVSCFGATDGSIRFNVTFQSGQNFTYSITGPSGFTSNGGTQAVINNLNNLEAGDYVINITDTATNCTYTTTHELEGPASALAITSINETQPTCLTDGSVSITATGGWGGYSFSLNNPDGSSFGTNSTGNFNGLTQPGTYNGTLTDSNNCAIPFSFTLDPATAPVLVVTPNQDCFDSSTLLTLTANVTSGGDGNFEYSINGAPFTTNNVFSNLSSGTYTIDVRDGKNCTDTETIVVNPELTVTASAGNITACGSATDVAIAGAGGDGNYVYAVVDNGTTPTSGDFVPNSTISVTGTGDYDVYVRDNGGSAGFCESVYAITIDQDLPLALSVSNTPILCSGDSSTISINVTGGEAPYTYSINNGANFQTESIFPNQPAGDYTIIVRDVNNCDITEQYSFTEPYPLSASAAITALIECNPTLGAEVRITNAMGGTSPYMYSFTGGSSYDNNPIGYLFAGNQTVYIRDANNCIYPMDVTVQPEPTPPTLSSTIDYECDGEGTVTITPSGGAYNYNSYSIDGSVNTPATNNVFNNVSVGTHTFEVSYISSTPPAPSYLFTEDFRSGVNTSIPEIDPLYVYEPQTSSIIDDGEYSVTNFVTHPGWVSPVDHTGLPNGRFLAINVGGVAGVGGIMYARRNLEVIPNIPITISLEAFNLLATGSGGGDPTIVIELVDGSGNVIESTATGNVPKNNGPNDWQTYALTLNPGANTNLDIVIRTNSAVLNGNDIAIDDLQAFQNPAQCPRTVSIDVIVEDGHAFEASIIGYNDLSCNNDGSGSITFEVDNFGPGGFEYSFTSDFSSILGSTTVSPQTISSLSAGNYTIYVREAGSTNPGCSTSISQVINEPSVVVADASQTQPYTCNNGGAIITASALGGIPGYTYQLENNAGSILTAYQTGTTFGGLTAGTYRVRVMDANGCTDLIDSPITITAPIIPVFTLNETACYSGGNDATIQVNVTDGNGDYQFRINGGTWVVPSPVNSTTYTFNGLSQGTYTIEVTDAYGCDSASQSITIEPQLTVTASAGNITACGSATDVAIAGAGGDGNYVYAVVDNGTTPTSGDFVPNSTISVMGTGDYDVYVRDNGGSAGFCESVYAITIDQDLPLALTISNTAVLCSGDSQSTLTIMASGGEGPYTYSIDNGASYVSQNTFNNLGAGSYNIRVRDANLCEIGEIHTITEPFNLSASAAVAALVECNPTQGAEVRITNAQGGTAPYSYSFDGGGTYTSSPIGYLLAGNHTVYVRDANNCTFPMDITVDPAPAPPTLSATVDYLCDGDGTVTVTPSSSDFDYTYSIDGNPNSPATSNIFNNVPAGPHTIDVTYLSTVAPAESTLLTEDFGSGPNTSIPQIDPAYCYEPGDGSTSACSIGDARLFDGEYTVTSALAPLHATWISPNDHTGNANGRYLAINVGGVVGVGGIVYSKRNVEVLPNQDITISFWALNLLRTGTSGGDPSMQIELVDGSGNIIASSSTAGSVPKNNGPDDWHNYSVSLNPGANTNLDIIFRTNSAVLDGNDIAIDDLLATQPPARCPGTTSIDVIVEDGNAFEASIIGYEDLDCNADGSGAITFEVENFGIGGFEYSFDSGFATIDGSDTVSPYTITGLAAGNYTIYVREAGSTNPGCRVSISQTISEPAIVTFSETVVQPTCVDGGSVTITTSGGTAGYTYQIEEPNGNIVGPQSENIFTGLNEIGIHTITVTDTNGCTATDTFTLNTPVNPVISIDPSSDLCYDSSNPGSATVVIGGSGGLAPYVFRMNSGPYRTSNTFANLTPGNYTFEIRDANGCTDDLMFTIEPQLTANIVLSKDIDCTVSPDAILDLQVNGGYSPFTYELNIDNGGYTSYTGTFPFTTNTPGLYRFRVTDSQGCVAESNEVTVTAVVNPLATETVTDPTCNGDSNGIVEINIDPAYGSSPYEISFNGSPFTSQRVYPGLAAGTYTYTLRDSKSCTYTQTVTVNDPVLFDANVVATDVSCGGSGDIPGRIDINITSGGVPNFTYTLYDNQNNIVVTTGPNPIVNTSSTTASFEGLTFGDYYVRVLDANGCEFYQNPVRVLSNPYLTVDALVPAVSCATGGSVDLLASGGSGNYDFTIYGSGTAPNTEVAGPGTGEESASYLGLNPGQSYVFQVIDTDTNCSSYVEVDIPTLSSIDVVSDPVVNDVACFGDTNGSIAFQIEGHDAGVSSIYYEIRESISNTPLGGAYSGTITGSSGPSATPVETVSGIPPGDYVLFFREDSAPDCTNTFEFRIIEPNPVTLNLVDQNNGYCSENANITVIAGGGNGSYTYAYMENGVTPAASDYETSNYKELDPAVNTEWDVYVIDGNGCAASSHLDITIAEDPSPLISAVVVNQCAANEGEFIVEVTLDGEGIQPYTLSVNSGSYQSSTLTTLGTTHQFTNLSSGNYTIDLRDFNGCGNQVSLEIFKPSNITAEVQAQPTCLGRDGAILITAYGGSGAYEYELFFFGGASVEGRKLTPLFSNLDPGMYTAAIYDLDPRYTGCTALVDIELEVPTAVDFTTSITDVTCFGGNDGSIVVSLDPTMDNPPYSYQLMVDPTPVLPYDALRMLPQGPAQSSNIFNNLSANDDYYVRVTSDRGCFLDRPVPIAEPDEILNVSASVVEFGCSVGNNADNATVTVNGGITGGSGNYEIYEFIDSASNVVQSGASNVLTVTDRTGESYTINVYDDNGCSGSTTATVLAFDEMTGATAAVTTTVTCAPGLDGEITVTATSTASDATKYEYSIDNGASYQVSNVFGGLAAGTYNFLVRHVDTGCIVTTSARIEEPNTFTIDVAKSSDVICYGTDTGEVTFSLVDATYAAGFDWEVFDTNGTPNDILDDVSVATGDEAAPTVNLGAGNYYVSVTQDSNPFCTNRESFTISGPSADITGTTVVTDITCATGDNDGSITITNVAGGWGGYTYYVGTAAPSAPTDFVPNATFGGLTAGTYQAWARDGAGCERLIQDNIVLDVPAPIAATLQVVQENCTNLQGEIEVSAPTGGQGSGYTYQLILDGSDFRAPQNTRVFSGLGAGVYEVRITDQWNCDFTTLPVELYEQLGATTTVDKAIDCTGTPGGTITVNVTGGSANLEFEMTPPSGPNVVQTNDPVFTGLVDAGTYTFIVRDLDTNNPTRCETTATQILDAPVVPVFTETHIDITCFGADNGSITLAQTQNGVNPLTFTISPVAGTFNTSSNTFENLPPNTYSITATGTNSCTSTIIDIEISEPDEILNVSASVVEFGCSVGNNDNNATVTVNGGITGGSGNYEIYEFIDSASNVVQSGASNVLTVTDRTGESYTINVYDDNGCSGSTTATVLAFDEMTGATAAVTTTVTCAPGLDGEITVTATSTASDATKYEYSIDNGASYQVSNVFGGLAAGTYNFLVRHVDTGCIVTTSARIEEPNTFTIDVAKSSDVICYGTDTGEVTFSLVDATYAAGFDWEVFDTNGTPNDILDDVSVATGDEAAPTVNLGAGNYYVSVTQDSNPFCTNRESFTISGPSADITGTTVVTDITCATGDNDGSITITNVAGGWGGYTYYVGTAAPSAPTDFVPNATFGGLTAGTYQAWARDGAGCERLIQDNIVLDVPAPIAATLQVVQENCTNLQGEIEVSAPTGGQGSGYTYQLVLGGTDFRSPQNIRVFSGLGAGVYEVTITDQWGCSFTTPPVELYEQLGATTAVTKPIDCSTTVPGGTITVDVTGGSANLEFEMTPPSGPNVVQMNDPVFTGLVDAGTYTFTVRDLDTTNPVCQTMATQVLDAPVVPVLLDATIVDVSCFGGSDGSIRANMDPSTNSNPAYQYELYSTSDLVTPIAPLQDNPLFTGLAAGDYQVRVVSSRGCEGIKNETVSEPTQLLIDATVTEFTCSTNNSVNTATITVNVLDGATTSGVSSGTSPYLYSLDNVIFQRSNTFNIADNGSEQIIDVFVKDDNGCTETTSVTVQPINTFTATVTRDLAITCTNDEIVTISVTDNGLAHSYSFELLPIGNSNGTLTTSTATTAEFSLSAVGSYNFRVTDLDTGCYVVTDTYSIAPFDFITATATATSVVTCYGDTNGGLSINIDGYSGTYDYQIFDTAGNAIGSTVSTDTSVNPRQVGNISGGNYYVQITETSVPLCSENTNVVTIASPDRPLDAVVNPIAEVTCTNDKGEISVTPSGGYKPYDITLTNTLTGENITVENVQEMTFGNLAAGDYTIQIADNVGCFITRTETLIPATPIIANATPLVTDLACYGDTGAVISAIVTGGGSGSYGYQLNYYDASGTTILNTTGIQNNPNFNDLGAGIYSITVVDGWDCDMTTNTVEITQPTEIQASLLRTNPLTCATGAEFELTATGGSGTYEYSVDNITYLPMTTNPLGLPEAGIYQHGRYQFYVRDAINGCEAALSNAITENEILPLTLTVDDTAAVLNCSGENTAIIYATAEGGLGNYQYELFTDSSLSPASRIAGPQIQGVFRNLSAGTYYVSVTSEDCTTQAEEVIIEDPIPLSYTESIIDVSCAGENNGQITVTLSGGAGGYQYAISPNLNQAFTTNTFTDLAPGEYTILAQDRNGCFEYLTYTISEPDMLVVNPTVTPEICVDSQDGSIVLEILGGTAPYSTAINANGDADFVLGRTEFINMAADNYLIFVRDANGCETNVIVDIERGVNLNATVEPVYECSSDMPNNYVNITLEDDSVIGDVLYAIDSVDPEDLQLNPDFRDSAPGNHYITIAHANGCLQTIDFVIEAFDPLSLTLEQHNLNEITAVAEGGREAYTYYFDGIDNGNSNTFFIDRTDTFEVRVVDQNGCESIANIYMEFIDIELPNFFTPDGDGQNDFWIPRNMEQFPEILIKIFDRYGRVVSQQFADSEGWDGTYSGKFLPTGDYWYVIKLNGERDEREFVGHFTLYR
ncbi:T9SS type B sorting domain-containing protein [Maribacter sp. MAR_2009_72]|uniref:T9SS type B sorting domain-containing protein n=1 Tax=Maribacter sp. MAR_2009_72 TaxID=1250050 RepID=UPI0016469C7E|nr:T9SS type B sorting domain-containing protein [Maribacter sp. MAR_2009_72]